MGKSIEVKLFFGILLNPQDDEDFFGRDLDEDDEDEEVPDNLGRRLAKLAEDFQSDPDVQHLVDAGLLPASIVDWLRIDYKDLNLSDGTLPVTEEEQQAFRDFFEGVKLPYQQPEWFLGVLWF